MTSKMELQEDPTIEPAYLPTDVSSLLLEAIDILQTVVALVQVGHRIIVNVKSGTPPINVGTGAIPYLDVNKKPSFGDVSQSARSLTIFEE